MMLGILLSLGLVVASLPAVTAQDTAAPTLPGFGDVITWTDESGNAIASVTVDNIEDDFRGYEEGWDPEFGYKYVLIDISAVNESEQSIILEAFPFQLIDDYGDRHSRINLNSAGLETFNDNRPLASGESAEFTLAFQIPAHATATLIVWGLDSNQVHYVVLSTDVTESSAVVWGMESPSVMTDDFTNPVATFQVNDVNENWDGYDDFSEPEDGMRYVAVSMTVTNETDRPVDVEYYDFSLALANGNNPYSARVSVKDGVEEPFRDRVRVQSGDSLDLTVVYEVPADVPLIGVLWSLHHSQVQIVVLADAPAGVDDGIATPVATPN